MDQSTSEPPKDLSAPVSATPKKAQQPLSRYNTEKAKKVFKYVDSAIAPPKEIKAEVDSYGKATYLLNKNEPQEITEEDNELKKRIIRELSESFTGNGDYYFEYVSIETCMKAMDKYAIEHINYLLNG